MSVGIVTEILKLFTYVIINESKTDGYLPKTDLPFNLCSIQVVLFIILVCSKSEKVKRALRCFMIPTCLVGGTAALFLATSSFLNYPTITIQYFGFHCAIIIFAIYLLASKEFTLTIKDYLRTLAMLVATMVIAIYINSILATAEYTLAEDELVKTYQSINYMYVVNGPKNGIPFLNKDHGWLVYIIHYICLCVFAVSCCYAKPIIQFFKIKLAKKN